MPFNVGRLALVSLAPLLGCGANVVFEDDDGSGPEGGDTAASEEGWREACEHFSDRQRDRGCEWTVEGEDRRFFCEVSLPSAECAAAAEKMFDCLSVNMGVGTCGSTGCPYYDADTPEGREFEQCMDEAICAMYPDDFGCPDR